MNGRTLAMPRLGETMDEGVIIDWLVAPGEQFKRGQPILELETDKTVVEFPALGDGVIEETLVSAGDTVSVGSAIARIGVADVAEWAGALVEAAEEEGVEEHAPPADTGAGAPSILRMPRLGETMEEGEVSQWLIAEGDDYRRGDAILEIETDKTAAEVPALHDGRLLRILAEPGSRIAVGAPLAEVEGEVEPFEAASPADTDQPEPVPPGIMADMAPAAPHLSGSLRATPLARRLARTRSIDLEQVTGTGRRGRIERADVERMQPGAGQGLAGLDFPDGRLAYRVTGSGGHPFLLLHGFAGSHDTWASIAASLARSGHRAIVPDLPGHGATTLGAETIEQLVAPVLRLAETIPEDLTVVGHSLGAAVAVEVARVLGPRARSVLLLSPAGCGPVIGQDFIRGMASATTAGEVSHALRLLGGSGAALSDTMLALIAAEMARGRLRALVDNIVSAEGRQKIDILRPLADLQQPVTAIFGTADRVVSPQDALNLPFGTAARFVPTGHMPQWDAASDVLRLMLELS